MQTIARRELLGGTASLLALRTLPRALVGAAPMVLMGNRDAHAWVMVAVAVAATVAGMIAAHNAGDGGIAAMLSANYELLKVAISKLDDIQTRLTELYKKIEELPDAVDRLLIRNNARQLQIQLQSVVRGYSEKLKNRDPALPFEQWRKEETTQKEMADLLGRLLKARQEANVSDLIDPVTALVATCVCFVEINLKNILTYRRYEIGATIRNIYLPWLDMILDPARSNSALGFTAAAADRLDRYMTDASNNALGSDFGLTGSGSWCRLTSLVDGICPPRTDRGLLACTGVNDFRPQKEKYGPDPFCGGPMAVPGTPAPASTFSYAGRTLSLAEAAEQTGLPQSDLQNVKTLIEQPELLANKDVTVSVRCPQVVVEIIPARRGPADRLAVDATLKEVELVVEGKPTGVLVFELAREEERRGNAGAPPIPPEGRCEVQTHDMEDANTRLTQMRSMQRRVEAENAYRELTRLINLINLERSRIAFGIQAAAAAEICKRNLVEIMKLYS